MPDSHITKNALAASIKELMQKKTFAKISVSDICENCGMNRKSFYYHFKDKYDLINWIFYTGFIEQANRREYNSGFDLLSDLCHYFYQERMFYRAALKIQGQNSFRQSFFESLHPLMAFFIQDTFQEKAQKEMFLNFYSDAVLSAIIRWLMADSPMPADEFMDNIYEIVTTLAIKVLEAADEMTSVPDEINNDVK